MDAAKQLLEEEATGWQRGVYDDIKATFRAPIVNWIFRSLMANQPGFTRYLWGQVKPVLLTAGFAECSVAYRDTVLTRVEEDGMLPAYQPGSVGVSPAAYRELCAQVETFDVVAPRLAVFFALVDHGFRGDGVPPEPDQSRNATAPFPAWLDNDRGRSPTMLDVDSIPAEITGLIEEIQEFHGVGSGIPSVYRCLAQWPSYLETAWTDLESRFTSQSFRTAREEAGRLVEEFVTTTPYHPRISPADLEGIGLGAQEITELQELFERFVTGPAQSVVPALPVYAATVGATGARGFP